MYTVFTSSSLNLKYLALQGGGIGPRLFHQPLHRAPIGLGQHGQRRLGMEPLEGQPLSVRTPFFWALSTGFEDGAIFCPLRCLFVRLR